MKKATFDALQKALESANIESLLNEVLENEEDEKSYGLSFNVETDELKFIPYLTDEDKTFENAFEMQNRIHKSTLCDIWRSCNRYYRKIP